MEIKEFIKLEDEVKQILIDNEQARNDDMFLYYLYVTTKVVSNKLNWVYGSEILEMILFNKEFRKEYKIRPYESVSRCRRKIQAQCQELASERAIRKIKKEQEKDFKEYAKL